MKQRKIPMRKDIVTGEMAPKKQLVRIVRNKDGEVSIDPTGKMQGRGAYVSIDVEVAKKAKKEKTFNSVFSVDLDEDFYNRLLDYVEHQQARQELIDNDKL